MEHVIKSNIVPFGGFADPHSIVSGDKVYIVSGSDKSPKTEDTWRMDKWCIFESDNLTDWNKVGEILPKDSYIGDNDNNCWAGYILEKDNKFYWFFSNKNIDTGVMVADDIKGPYKDLIGKPLIPKGIAPTSSYDPCVYEENGEYTIFFGAGKYYCAKLNDDFKSLKEEPKPITVLDDNGNELKTSDKSTVFKRNDTYYLCYGERYAISKNLTGPYRFMGRFVGGGHNDVFIFKDNWYVCNEFHDTNIFYRGIRVIKLVFDEDGKVVLGDDDTLDMADNKIWDFTIGNNNWFLTDLTDPVMIKEGAMVSVKKDFGFRSPILPGVILSKNNTFSFVANAVDKDMKLTVKIEWVEDKGAYWNIEGTEEIFTFDISKKEAEYSFNLNLEKDNCILRKITFTGCNEEAYSVLIKRVSCN